MRAPRDRERLPALCSVSDKRDEAPGTAARLTAGTVGPAESTRKQVRRAVLLLAGVLGSLMTLPAVAAAHGPVAPVATSYVAKLRSVPPGLEAKVVDGYVRLWLRVSPRTTALVLDYRGAPYLRFDASGVQVNEHSEMYYLNQAPYPWAVPSSLTRATPPRWLPVAAGHAYEWHDGRLQALASVAVQPGSRYAGRWTIPMVLDGHSTVIAGGLWDVPAPSVAWFWPLVVVLLCVLAALRVQSDALDVRLARALGIAAVVALTVACAGRELHGRPGVPAIQYVELALVSVFAVWQLCRLLVGSVGFFSYLVIALVALWQGLDIVPTLVNGYVLIDLPAVMARAAAVACLACAVCLGLLVFRLESLEDLRSRRRDRVNARAITRPDHPPTTLG